MELTVKNVNRRLNEYTQIKELIQTAFPENEQIPMWLLLLISKRKCVDFLAFYDDSTFCGISYTVRTEKMVFVLYLAVSNKIRSKGYGSKILNHLKVLYKEKEIVLNIEPVDEKAENNSQRIRRLEFYKKNGFSDTGEFFRNKAEKYSILSTSKNFAIEEYNMVIKKASFGLYINKKEMGN